MLTTPMMAEETLTFSGPTAIDGIDYEYYVESFDVLGNLSPISSILAVTSTTGIIHIDVWSLAYHDTNGWDTSNPLISGTNIDYDLDGLVTLWEYLQGKTPTVADSAGASFPDNAVVEDGGNHYLEFTCARLETLPSGLVVKVQCSDNLTAWPVEYIAEGAIPDSEVTITPATPSGGICTITVRLNTPIGDPAGHPFARRLLEER